MIHGGLSWLWLITVIMAQPEKWEAPVALPYARTMKALKLFPCIGDPGAEKILLFRGVVAGLPLESNGLRVLMRIGHGRAHLKNYGAMYRGVQEAIAPELDDLPRGPAPVPRMPRRGGLRLQESRRVQRPSKYSRNRGLNPLPATFQASPIAWLLAHVRKTRSQPA